MTLSTTGAIRVAVVDDQPLLVSAFSALVAAQPDMEVVLEAVNGRQAVEGLTARATGPHGGADLVLMDLRMPVLDGVSAIRELRAAPATASLRVLVLTTFDDDDLVLASLGAGAHGFLLKDADPEFLLAAIRTVHSGSSVIAASATRDLFEHFAEAPKPVPAQYTDLTDREREIFALAARGLSNSEIAAREYLSEATVKTHISRILSKLALRDRVQLVVFAFEHGLA